MEYVYAAMLLHSAGKEINAEAVGKVLKAAGVEVDEARVKSLVASLDGVNIDEAIEKSVVTAAAPASAPAAPAGDSKADEKKAQEEEKAHEEEAASGLASLFG
ncbi:MAG: 50S ribosomal protein P1 [Candidatus Altiarchaeota archaeon]